MTILSIVVGNVGTVFETEDKREASDIYRHYCDASDRGDGRMARETVTMCDNDGEPILEHVGYDARLESMDTDAFMTSFVTVKTSWYVVDHRDGVNYFETSLVGDLPGLKNVGDAICFLDDDCNKEDKETIHGAIGDYVNTHDVNDIEGVERIEGHGARLSASGYMDCTDWTVHATEHDAIVYLVETYADKS